MKKLLLPLAVVAVLSGCSTGYRDSGSRSDDGYRDESSRGDGYRRVGRVAWHKEENVDAQTFSDRGIPNNATGVFFYRSQDNDGLQTSANVAINDRFQVSLQPGNFSHVYSCSGINDLSVDITGHKNNDLKRGLAAYNLRAGNNYYFNVEVDGSGQARIQQVSKQIALQAMNGMPRQSHQITRVVPNCAPAPSRIQLQVLFDTDKHYVKPHYYAEIERVVRYMRKHPKTTAVLEGHTDSRQTDAYNMALSQRRVNAVMKILVQKYGISQQRLKAIGYGESRPIAPNNSPANMQKNRRVMAVFSYK